MSTRTIRRAATTILAILLTAILGVAAAQTTLAAGTTPTSPASALTPSTIKQHCEAAISRRLTSLSDLQNRVGGASVLTAAHRSALLGIIGSDRSGLSALEAKIAADTSASQLRADCQDIVTGYRVYVLVVPQVHLTIAADRVDFVDDKIQGLHGKLEVALQGCSAGPAECQAAEQAFDDLQSKVRQSNQAVAGVAAEVLGLTPAGYPGNAAVLDAARTSVQNAHTALEDARHDITIIRQALRPSAAATPEPATPTPTPAAVTPSPAG
jgi:hypothetical protein